MYAKMDTGLLYHMKRKSNGQGRTPWLLVENLVSMELSGYSAKMGRRILAVIQL